MPKAITPPTNLFATPERDRCIEAARRAAGENSGLDAGQIEFLAELAMQPEKWLVRHIDNKPDRAIPLQSERLALCFFRDTDAACRAIAATRKEWGRIRSTAFWCFTEAIRQIAFEQRLKIPAAMLARLPTLAGLSPKKARAVMQSWEFPGTLDAQCVIERAETLMASRRIVPLPNFKPGKSLHKALRLQRAVPTSGANPLSPELAASLARGHEVFGSNSGRKSRRPPGTLKKGVARQSGPLAT